MINFPFCVSSAHSIFMVFCLSNLQTNIQRNKMSAILRWNDLDPFHPPERACVTLYSIFIKTGMTSTLLRGTAWFDRKNYYDPVSSVI